MTINPADALLALTPLVEALEKLGVQYYLGGSVASSAYGIARSTLDVDLVADLLDNEYLDAWAADLGLTDLLERARRENDVT